MNIYVGNLAYSVTEEDLQKLFGEFGEVGSVNIIIDKFTGRSKVFAFVEMPNNSQADEAIKALNGKVVQGRDLKVNQARPRTDRAPGGGGGGGGGGRSGGAPRRPRY